jgi:hypothetical protein
LWYGRHGQWTAGCAGKGWKRNLIPLPQQADPNAVLAIVLKLAERSKNQSA